MKSKKKRALGGFNDSFLRNFIGWGYSFLISKKRTL